MSNDLFFTTCFILQKLVIQNKEVLAQLRTSFDKPDVMRDLFRRLISKYSFGGLVMSPHGLVPAVQNFQSR